MSPDTPFPDEEWPSAPGPVAGAVRDTGGVGSGPEQDRWSGWDDDAGAAAGEEPGDGAPPSGGDDETLIEDEGEPPDPRTVLTGIGGLLGRLGGVHTGDVRVDGANAMGHGSFAIGRIIVGSGATGSDRVWREVLTADQVRDLADGYASTVTDDHLDQAMKRHPLVRLTGPEGSGRYTTACLALARRYGMHRVGVVTTTDLTGLAGADTPFTGGFGYVVTVDQGAREADGLLLAALATRAGNRGYTLVLVESTASDQRGTLPTVVHGPPVPVEVFAAQLRRHLRQRCLGGCPPDCRGDCVQSYLDAECLAQPALRAYLDGTPRPWEVVQVVAAVAARLPTGAELTRLLDRLLPGQVRRRAREILNPQGPGGGDHVRAFRLSCAVLAGHGVAAIQDAAHRLVRPGPDGPVFTTDLRAPDLDDLLGTVLAQAVLVDRTAWTRRTLRFRPAEEELRRTLLEVAWAEWAPDRLLGWFGLLARSDDPATRRAAAGAIGWAAGRDLDAALTLVDDLARDRRAGVRQAAGIALVAMAMQPALRNRVRTRISAWAQGRAYQRDTVARAYGLGLARLWPDEALAQVRLAAEFRSQRWHNSVGRALLDLHESGHTGLLLRELAGWVTSGEPELVRHAARTVRVLAERWSPAPRAHWPELLDLLRAGVVDLADLAILWRTALSLPATGYRSWRIVGYWINQADGRPEVTDACLRLLREVVTTAQLRRRLRHQVRHVWRPIMPTNRLLSAVALLAVEDVP
ncbi:hypothetical protein [Micromonospora cathayae]|uniref:HEAT repeat-containing protein n=1 Tax=Micromonospora cathayae TaxID=3028804 RepID=A0ABY7ZHQ8_9ACTN|nr:hypothetical protein [Micromonospora sp. HUAS 3]WDZ82367.1 hypothetical protein PVK37_17890 [Micromonospora sp. HUAS 3]